MVTQDDVAKYAGVDRSTVSLVVNGSPKVSDKTRAEVMKAIEKLGYYPNHMARALKTSRTETVAVMINDATSSLYSSVIRTASRVLATYDYNLIFCNSCNSIVTENHQLRGLIEKRVDGIVVVSNSSMPKNHHFSNVIKSGIPFVLINNYGPEYIDGFKLSKIYIDYEKGMYETVATLAKLGHRKILGIGLNEESAKIAHSLRARGFNKAILDYGLHGLKINLEDPSFESAMENIKHLREEIGKEYTAVVCVNDFVAVAVMHVAASLGLNVGTDISIIGFDNFELCDFLFPTLSSVRHPLDEATKIALDWILEAVLEDSLEPLDALLPCELILRGSVGPIAL